MIALYLEIHEISDVYHRFTRIQADTNLAPSNVRFSLLHKSYE